MVYSVPLRTPKQNSVRVKDDMCTSELCARGFEGFHGWVGERKHEPRTHRASVYTHTFVSLRLLRLHTSFHASCIYMRVRACLCIYTRTLAITQEGCAPELETFGISIAPEAREATEKARLRRLRRTQERDQRHEQRHEHHTTRVGHFCRRSFFFILSFSTPLSLSLPFTCSLLLFRTFLTAAALFDVDRSKWISLGIVCSRHFFNTMVAIDGEM